MSLINRGMSPGILQEESGGFTSGANTSYGSDAPSFGGRRRPDPTKNPRKARTQTVPDTNVPEPDPDASASAPDPGKDRKDKKAATREDMETNGCTANCPPEEDTSKNDPPPATSTPETSVQTADGGPQFSLAGLSLPQILILLLVLFGLYANS